MRLSFLLSLAFLWTSSSSHAVKHALFVVMKIKKVPNKHHFFQKSFAFFLENLSGFTHDLLRYRSKRARFFCEAHFIFGAGNHFGGPSNLFSHHFPKKDWVFFFKNEVFDVNQYCLSFFFGHLKCSMLAHRKSATQLFDVIIRIFKKIRTIAFTEKFGVCIRRLLLPR